MQIAIEAPRNSDVRYVEELIVRATRKSDVQGLPYTAMRTVAAAYIFDAYLLRTAVAQDCSSNSAAFLGEANELRSPLDIDADLFQLTDEKSLMIVLCIC